MYRTILWKIPSLPRIFLLFLLVSPVRSQSLGKIHGLVTDRKTHTPLIGVNIILENTVFGATTDRSGHFYIDRIRPGNFELKVTMIGYKPEKEKNIIIQAGKTVFLNITMDETVLLLDPVVVTAVKYPQSLSASHQAMDVVTSVYMMQKLGRKIDENLTHISGIHFNESNISIRGSSGYSVYNVGSRVLLMIDGVPALTSDLGAINWEMLPFLDVERIEVVKGAGSALYGSSAMGGIVNIITRRPSPKGVFHFRTLAGIYDKPHYNEWQWTTRTLHYERADISYSRQLGPVGLRLGLSRYVSTGYMENDDTHQWNTTGRFHIRLPSHSSLDIYIAWMDYRRGWLIQWLNQNRPFEVPPFNKEDEFNYETLNLYLLYNLPLSSRFAIKFRISHLLSKMGSQIIGDRSSTYDPKAFNPGQGLGWEIQGDWILSKRDHITFGIDFRRDITGSKYFGNHKGYTLSSYLQEEWTLLDNLKTTVGIRIDHHTLTNEESHTNFSPKAGLNYKPFQGTVLRATLGKGFRAATVFEKYIQADYSGFNVIPNPDLKPESSWFYDVGFRQTFHNGHVECSLFQTDYWDMIEPVINFLGTIQFQNYIRARIRGFELAIESWCWKKRIGLSTSVTYIDPRDISRNETLPYRPKITGTITGMVHLGPFSAQAEYRFASRVENVQINPLDPRVPLKLLQIRAQLQWRNMMFQLAVNNALNYHYTQVERRMGEIRNVSLGVVGKF